MKFRACTLTGFGKFYRKSFSFSDGIHVIYGENEAGKTTLCTFLISMLFGLERKRGSASKKDEFHKYQPYMGGIYGGNLDIEQDGILYQIQRNFAVPKDITIYEEQYGKKILEGQEPSGTLFSMTKTGYLQTLCISQGEIRTDKSLGQMLRSYLTNMSQSKSQDVNVDEAVAYLRREVRKTKHMPVYDEMEQIREQIRHIEDKNEELLRIQDQENRVLEEMEQLDAPMTLWERIKAWIRAVFGLADSRTLERQRLEYQLELLRIRRKQLEEIQEINENLRLRFDNLKEEIKEIEYNKKAMEDAIKAILEAAEEIHQEFGSEFQQKVCDIIAVITDGTYEKIRIDDSMGIVVEKEGSFLDIDYLSTGTIEQIYFAVRLAAAEILFPKESFPIILDDIFGNFDQTRMKLTLEYLSRLDRQVFIFSCRKEVIKQLEEINCGYRLIQIM
jgi:uncharacterized protein YhaN